GAAVRSAALAERVPCRRNAAHDAASVRSAGLADAAPPPAAADRGNLHARPVERRTPRTRLRPRCRAHRARILRRRSAGRAGDLRRGGRARARGADPQGARLQGPAIFLQRRADGNRAAAETASPDLVWRSCAGERPGRPARRTPTLARLAPPHETRVSVDRYRAIWPQVHARTAAFPKLGLGRFIVVAPSDAAALALARRAYLVWHASFTHLFRRHG